MLWELVVEKQESNVTITRPKGVGKSFSLVALLAEFFTPEKEMLIF